MPTAAPRNPSNYQSRWWASKDYASVSATTVYGLHKVKTRSIKVLRAHLHTDTTITVNASNYVNFQVLKGATVIANWSTQTGQQGTITAGTPVELVLSGTLANTFLADADLLTLSITITGTLTTPTGCLVVDGFEL